MSAAPQLAEDLFNEHYRRLYAYCLRQLGSPEEAEDAVQATYLNACRSLMAGFEPDAAQAWLFKVAHNVCLTRQRSTWRRARVERPHDLQQAQDYIAAPELPGDELFGLDDALAALPEQQRRAILLREWQGLSYREVGAKLGLTQAAVETLIFRARRSLATALEEPAKKRRRLIHAFDASALVASLKSAVTANASASIATAVAVAASATTIAAAPVKGALDFPSHAQPVAKTAVVEKPSSHVQPLSDRPEAALVVSATPSAPGSHTKGKAWAGTHPRAVGKGKKDTRHGNGHGKPAGQSHPLQGHSQDAPQPSPRGNANDHQSASASGQGQSAAPAYGKDGKKG
jgi:RNA polymerase sigma factor (sigma-70 family)